jgi:O-antigen ligase
MKYAISNPILGVGVGCFSEAEGASLTEAGLHGKWSNAHNAYVQAFAELGLPGGVLFVTLIVLSLRSALKLTAVSPTARKRPELVRPELAGSIIGLAVSAVFLSFAYFFAWFAVWGISALLADVLAKHPLFHAARVGPHAARAQLSAIGRRPNSVSPVIER